MCMFGALTNQVQIRKAIKKWCYTYINRHRQILLPITIRREFSVQLESTFYDVYIIYYNSCTSMYTTVSSTNF